MLSPFKVTDFTVGLLICNQGLQVHPSPDLPTWASRTGTTTTTRTLCHISMSPTFPLVSRRKRWMRFVTSSLSVAMTTRLPGMPSWLKLPLTWKRGLMRLRRKLSLVSPKQEPPPPPTTTTTTTTTQKQQREQKKKHKTTAKIITTAAPTTSITKTNWLKLLLRINSMRYRRRQ